MKRVANRFFKVSSICLLVIVVITFTTIIYISEKIPNKFYVVEGEEFEISNINYLIKDEIIDYSKTSMANNTIGQTTTIDLKLFGIVPVTQTKVSVISEQEITPGGTAFGIKLYTKGVLVVDVNEIPTSTGMICPAKTAGIKTGDIILSINDIQVYSNEQISKLIQNSNGEGLNIEYERNNIKSNTYLVPVISETDKTYKSGIWVRDSSAGIGTVTYYNKATGVFGGLGHGICDSDTGEIMPLSAGEVCGVRISGYKKGISGVAGELQGTFTSNEATGNILINNECGVFGVLEENPNEYESVAVRLKQDIKLGEASIISTIENGETQEYSINIDKIDLNSSSQTKNITITVTDPELLAKTGGIVQGMSGSPIMQEGEIVGAVTHVFVNNPAKGYGIFIENMLDVAESVDKTRATISVERELENVEYEEVA